MLDTFLQPSQAITNVANIASRLVQIAQNEFLLRLKLRNFGNYEANVGGRIKILGWRPAEVTRGGPL